MNLVIFLLLGGITDPELKYVAQKDMHTALLYIAKKQLNIEERAGEVVPSPGVCGREGRKEGKKVGKVGTLGRVTLGIPDLLTSLVKALDREFCFGRKKKKRKTWNHTLASHYEVPLFQR